MKQQAQTRLMLGIGAITVALIAGYFGLDHLINKKAESAPAATEAAAAPAVVAEAKAASAAAPAVESSEYSATIAAAAPGTGTDVLTAEDARRIGEEVARQVATQVAQGIVGQAGGAVASTGGGLSAAEARRIGAEEGRRVAQEVAASTIQQALAANGSGSGGLSAAEAEQIGLAAGRRAAQQIAAATAREVVRKEFGGKVTTDVAAAPATRAEAAPPPSRKAAAASKPSPSTDALRAWWTPPSSGDFGLLYAGQANGESAIALLFSAPPADGALAQHIRVYDAKGTLVSSPWEVTGNPRMAVMRGLAPGRYTVILDSALADSSGKAVNKGQHGPVYLL